MKNINVVPLVMILLWGMLISAHVFAEDKPISYESKVVENFDDDEKTKETLLSRWIVRPSKFVKTFLDINDNIEKPDVQIARVNAWPQALHGKNLDSYPYYVMGVTASFTRHGYNYLEIMPARVFDPEIDLREFVTGKDQESDVVKVRNNKKYVVDSEKIIYKDQAGKEWVSNPILFEGRSKALSIWVWGSNFNYSFEAHLEDHRGVIHVLKMGLLNFEGWKNLSVDIPGSIPQVEKYIPKLRRLKLVKFMIWTQPDERISDFYIYLDQFKILTDLFESRFDGDELTNPEKMKEIWGDRF